MKKAICLLGLLLFLILTLISANAYTEDSGITGWSTYSSVTELRGMNVTSYLNTTYAGLQNITKDPGCSCTKCYAYNKSVRMADGSFVSNKCTLNQTVIWWNNTNIYLMCDAAGAGYQESYTSSAPQIVHPLFIWQDGSVVGNVYNGGQYLNIQSFQYYLYEPTTPEPHMTIHNNMVDKTDVIDYTTEHIGFNATFTDESTTYANCSLYVNGVYNQSFNGNISIEQEFDYFYGFKYGNVTFRINCSNFEANDLTSVYTYDVDTTRILLYEQGNDILESISDLNEAIDMNILPLTMTILFIGLWTMGFWFIQNYNNWAGYALIALTIPVDIYFAYTFQETKLLGTGFIGTGFSLLAAATMLIILVIKRKTTYTHA